MAAKVKTIGQEKQNINLAFVDPGWSNTSVINAPVKNPKENKK